MEIGKTLYVKDRKAWRKWLEKNHPKTREIWLIYYKKHTGKPRISYNDAVEEALCFGWIDSTVKRIDNDRIAQRYTPRKKGSPMSALNKERVRGLIKAGLMKEIGLAHAGDLDERFRVPKDIAAALRKNKEAWKNFGKFPRSYQRVRIAYIDGARIRPEEFRKRLDNFIKQTEKNKKFGTFKDAE